jgi:hypothetical protein
MQTADQTSSIVCLPISLVPAAAVASGRPLSPPFFSPFCEILVAPFPAHFHFAKMIHNLQLSPIIISTFVCFLQNQQIFFSSAAQISRQPPKPRLANQINKQTNKKFSMKWYNCSIWAKFFSFESL